MKIQHQTAQLGVMLTVPEDDAEAAVGAVQAIPGMSAERGCGQLAWSAFGAEYMDTECQNGDLLDLDSLTFRGTPCPLCQPLNFFEHEWDGTGVEPTCCTCLTRLTPDLVTFHDGKALTWTVKCPKCTSEQPALMRDYDPEGDGEER